MTVDIVIVNWNSGTYLSECLRSIEQLDQTLCPVVRVVVVDNASTDESFKQASSIIPLVIVRNSMNLGFAAASNQGARQSTADFLLFLNPDVRLQKNSLAGPIAHFLADPELAVAGIRLIGEDGTTQRSCCRIPTAVTMLLHAVGLDRCFRRMGYVMAEWPHDETRKVDHLIGAFYLVRRRVFEQLGGFDERFFVYLEDLDLSKRVKDAGFKSVFVAEVAAFHAGGGTTRAIKARRLFYALRSRLQYVEKHHDALTYCTICFATLGIEPLVRTIAAGAKLSPAEIRQTWTAYRLLARWFIAKGLDAD